MAEVVPPGIPAEEFPHADEYQSEKNTLPEWWQIPEAVKQLNEKAS
jgi:hypothetical protein